MSARTLILLGAGGLLTYALYKALNKTVAAPGTILATPVLPLRPTQTSLPDLSGGGFIDPAQGSTLPVLPPAMSVGITTIPPNDPSNLFDPSALADVPSDYYSSMMISDPGVSLDQPFDVGSLTTPIPQSLAALGDPTGSGLLQLTQPPQTGAHSYSAQLLYWVEGWENFIPYKYSDVAQTSIGYGTRWVSGMPTTITQTQAEAALMGELNSAADAVNSLITVPLSQNQFDALVSFQFNTGALARIAGDLNAGDTTSFLNRLNQYVHSGGSVNNGLVRRRMAETQMFLNGVYSGP